MGRLNTDIQNGLSHPQVRANLEMYGLNDIGTSLHVPEWIRFCKMIMGGSSLLLWAGAILCFVSFSIQAGLVSLLFFIFSYRIQQPILCESTNPEFS